MKKNLPKDFKISSFARLGKWVEKQGGGVEVIYITKSQQKQYDGLFGADDPRVKNAGFTVRAFNGIPFILIGTNLIGQ